MCEVSCVFWSKLKEGGKVIVAVSFFSGTSITVPFIAPNDVWSVFEFRRMTRRLDSENFIAV